MGATEVQNVLYVQTQGAVLHLDHDTVRVEVERETRLRAPLMRLSGIVVFGQVTITPFLIQRCAEDGRNLVWLTSNGRFRGRLQGRVRGNVLLRRVQHLVLAEPVRTCQIARQFVAAKIQNCRQVLLRGARDAGNDDDEAALVAGAERLADVLVRLRSVTDLEVVRGMEGEAARTYFGVFPRLVKVSRDEMGPRGRTRRPPTDRANALLSFLYTLILGECSSALETAGLDPQIGYLHSLRPGRAALALDLMEELRPVLADKLALALINRRQLQQAHFEDTPGHAVLLNEDGRRIVLGAYQKRKEEEVRHRVFRQNVPLGLVPLLQARLLARHLRGDLADYLPFLQR